MGYILCDWHEVYVILHELRIKRGLLKKKSFSRLLYVGTIFEAKNILYCEYFKENEKILFSRQNFSSFIKLMWFHNFFQTAVIIKAYIQHFRFRQLNALHIQTLSNCCKHNYGYDQIFWFIWFLAGFCELSILMYFKRISCIVHFKKPSFLFKWLTKCFAQVF